MLMMTLPERKATHFGGSPSHQLAGFWTARGGSLVGHKHRNAAVSHAQVRAETTQIYLVRGTRCLRRSAQLYGPRLRDPYASFRRVQRQA